MKHAILICGCAALALAACSKKTETAAGGPAATAEGAAKPAATAEAAPTRKAGLWEQTMSFNGRTQKISMCVDEATEQKAKFWASEGRASSGCSEERINRTLTGGWQIHSVCQTPEGMKITSDGTVTGDFGSSYHMEMTSVTTGSPMPEANGTHKMTMDGAWKGPCPAGMRAGDMVLPGGMKMNALNPAEGPGMAGVKPGHVPSQAEIAKMREQALAMEKAMKESGAK
jgi:hypothetical protein